MALPLFAYAALLLKEQRLPRVTGLDAFFAAFIVVTLAASLFSIYPRLSLEASLLSGFAVAVYYLAHDLPSLTWPRLVHGLAALTVLAALLSLASVLFDYVEWLGLVYDVDGGLSRAYLLPPAVPRVHGVGGHVNVVAMLLNLGLPLCLYLSNTAASRAMRYGWRLAFVTTLLAIFFTLSRGAWLGTMAALVTYLALSRLNLRELVASCSRWPFSWRQTVLAGLVALAAIAVLILGLFSWESRPEWLFRPSVSPRYDAAQVAWQIFRDRPWFGAGPFAFPLLYPSLSGEYPIENIHPHNGYLTVLVDLGVAGVLALALGGVLLGRQLWRVYRSDQAHMRMLAIACTASLTSLAVHSLVDTPNVWQTSLLPLAVLLALTQRLLPAKDDGGTAPLWSPRLLPAALLPLLVAGWIYADFAHLPYQDSIQALAEGNYARAVSRSNTAARRDPANAAASIEAGVSSAILYLVERDAGTRNRLRLEAAQDYFTDAIKHESHSALAYANLAITHRLLDQPMKAAAAANRALHYAPTDATIAVAAGLVLEWAGDREGALAAYATALRRDPGLAQSPFWGTSNERLTQLRPQAMAQAGVSACELGRVSAIYHGYRDDFAALEAICRAEVMANPGDAAARSGLALIIFAQGRYDEARTEAQAAVSRVPDNPFARTALGISKGQQGDLKGARRELMQAAQLKDADAALLLAYTFAPPAEVSNPIMANLSLPSSQSEVPASVIKLNRELQQRAAGMVFDNGGQNYLLGILYYRVRFQRQSPASLLIPDEWIGFASARAVFNVELLESFDARR